jgi:molecular chaperone DnaK
MKAVGIDLGMTNSAIAYYDSERHVAVLLANSEGEDLTPSVVGLRRQNSQKEQTLVGRTALNRASKAPQDTITSIKRLMGRDFADPRVVQARERVSYQIVQGPGEDPQAYVTLGANRYTPADVSSKILAKLKADAGRALGEDVTHAVITVPAYFQNAQRAATRKAGEHAGLVVKRIIDEPTAAAIAFGVLAREGERHRVLVYDLGGGMFDIAILHAVKDHQGHGQFQVVSYEGDNWLGGDDFDFCIVDKIIDWVRTEHGVDPSTDKAFLYLAKCYAEAAKRQLSQVPVADIVIPAALRVDGGPVVDVDTSITREEFDAMIEPLVAETMQLVQKALTEQNLTVEDVSDVLLAGGATLTPKVYETVERIFPGKVRRTINPMECVALGASILAGTLKGVECPACSRVNDDAATECRCGHSLASAQAVGEIGIYERTPMSLGIAAMHESQRDVFAAIIPKGTPYPLREPMTQQFQATERFVRVAVYEGDDPVASRNQEQGVIEFELGPEIAVPTRVEVAFNYDRNRVLTVTIKVPGTTVLRTETLRTDRPRERPGPAVDGGGEDDWQELEHAIMVVREFLRLHEPFIEPLQAMGIKRNIEWAQQVLGYSDAAEQRRMVRVLWRDVLNSGIATQLYLAERAVDGASSQLSQQINEAANIVRSFYNRGDRDRADAQVRVLKVLVAKALRERNLGTELDMGDAEGLLRIMVDPSDHRSEETSVPEIKPQPSQERPAEPPRLLHGRLPERVRRGDRVDLQVRVALSPDPERLAATQPIDPPSVALRPFEVPPTGAPVLLLLHSPGFTPRSPTRQEVVVPPRANSDWVLFELEATNSGVQNLEVTAFRGGTYLGGLAMQITVDSGLPTGPSVDRSQPMGLVSAEPGAVALYVRFDDVLRVYRYQLIDEDRPDEVVSDRLLQTPQQVVEGLVSQLNQLARDRVAYTGDQTRAWLRGHGIRLWNEFIPGPLQQQFWERRDRITSMTVISAKDPVPWELFYPYGPNAEQDAGFLAEQFPVFRWVFGRRPARRLPLSSGSLVLPDGSPDSANVEIEEVRALLDERVRLETTVRDLASLLQIFQRAQFNMLHFACHNIFRPDRPDTSAIILGRQPFQPVFMNEYAVTKRFAPAAPLVFMNACRTGGESPLYTQLAGWARSFIEAGAGAFLGSLWEVHDGSARTFATEFYRALLAGSTLGDALNRARESIRDEPGDPTWLAYTAYGDPTAVLATEAP